MTGNYKENNFSEVRTSAWRMKTPFVWVVVKMKKIQQILEQKCELLKITMRIYEILKIIMKLIRF